MSEDLKPYTCYFAECPDQNCFFDTFEAWRVHVTSGHRVQRGWICIGCKEPVSFDVEDQFYEHFKRSHEDITAKTGWKMILTACQRHEKPNLKICPVCSIDESTWALQKAAEGPEFDPGATTFLRHIGKCMHNLALRVLPSRDTVSDTKLHSDAPGTDSDSSRSSLSEISLPTKREGTYEQVTEHLNIDSLPRQSSGYEKSDRWVTTVKHMHFVACASESLRALKGKTLDPAEGHFTPDIASTTHLEGSNTIPANPSTPTVQHGEPKQLPGRDLYLLSLDGGGVRGLSSLCTSILLRTPAMVTDVFQSYLSPSCMQSTPNTLPNPAITST